MNKATLKKDLIKLRDGFKEYQDALREVYKARNAYDQEKESAAREIETERRESLIEEFGRLEKYMARMPGIMMNGVAFNRQFSIFDSALDQTLFDNPIKGEALKLAVQMAIKAVGVAESFEEADVKKLTKTTPIVFVSYNFAEKNKDVTEKIMTFIKSFPVAVSLGSEPDNKSVSSKVKGKINDADIVVGVMTADEKTSDDKYKSSDWIIQELAYALGQGKTIIRLIESNADKQGRIFGDSEYISFERADTSEALIKLSAVLQKKLEELGG